jgi:ubiquinone/menaquinone biosynthesis C-methylase UbiE
VWGGESLVEFLSLGFQPENLYGVDLLPERIDMARKRFPNANWLVADARGIDFPTGYFDITTESTMFVQITDDQIAKDIALEMIRVTKKDGYILLADWSFPKPGDPNYCPLDRKRMRSLFPQSKVNLEKSFHGAIVPPVGRFLSKRLPSLYLLVQRLIPFLVAQRVWVLRLK